MSATPVGDWIHKRYPPNDGATHWLGEGTDPGCCAGPHPACLYAAAWREATRSVEQALANATQAEPDPVARGFYQRAIEITEGVQAP